MYNNNDTYTKTKGKRIAKEKCYNYNYKKSNYWLSL